MSSARFSSTKAEEFFFDLRLTYLKTHKRVLYINLLTSCKLNEHLAEVDNQANEMLELLVKRNGMYWDYEYNIKACADEIIQNELIYV